MRAKGEMRQTVAKAALEMLEVDGHGFDEIDRRLLRTIIDKFGGGPVGVNTIAAAISEEKDAIEDIYEPFLIQIGLINRTPRGRVATARASGILPACRPRERIHDCGKRRSGPEDTHQRVGDVHARRILDNQMLSQMVDTSDESILQRTGIKTRHIVEKGVAASTWARKPR